MNRTKMKIYQPMKFIGVLSLVSMMLLSCTKDDPKPPMIEVADFEVSLDENPIAGQILGTLEASIGNGELLFELVSESNAGAFILDVATGEVSVGNVELYDFEDHPTLTGVVSVNSGEQSVSLTITVNVLNVAEDPTLYLYGVEYADGYKTFYYENGNPVEVLDGYGSYQGRYWKQMAINGTDICLIVLNQVWVNGVALNLPATFVPHILHVANGTLYILGRGANDELIVYKDEIEVLNLPSNDVNHYGYDLFVKGDDIYIAGFTAEQVPFYSKNTAYTYLTTAGLNSGIAYAITVIGEDVHVGGSRDNQPVIWTNGVPDFKSPSSGGVVSLVNHNDQLYSIYYSGAGVTTSHVFQGNDLLFSAPGYLLEMAVSVTGKVYTMGSSVGISDHATLYVDGILDTNFAGTEGQKTLFSMGLMEEDQN